VQYPNTELAVRNWLRGKQSLTSLLTAPAATRGLQATALVDLDPHPELPCVVVYRAGGQTDANLPLDRAVLGFDCWGTSSSRKSAMDLQVALLGALTGMASEPLGPDVYGYHALVQSALWSPDPGGRSRYVVTAVVTARRAALAA
jgi:hypothetical protein